MALKGAGYKGHRAVIPDLKCFIALSGKTLKKVSLSLCVSSPRIHERISPDTWENSTYFSIFRSIMSSVDLESRTSSKTSRSTSESFAAKDTRALMMLPDDVSLPPDSESDSRR